ncbi:hypothetical protein EVA_15527, partial [gut metagenome]
AAPLRTPVDKANAGTFRADGRGFDTSAQIRGGVLSARRMTKRIVLPIRDRLLINQSRRTHVTVRHGFTAQKDG